jgi:hypothetical protein
LEE